VSSSETSLYFPQSWRFSEDLDFDVEGEYQGSKQELRAILDTIADRSGIEFEIRESPRFRSVETSQMEGKHLYTILL
jgi:predicted nucleotidyltransferase component of viral defense system